MKRVTPYLLAIFLVFLYGCPGGMETELEPNVASSSAPTVNTKSTPNSEDGDSTASSRTFINSSFSSFVQVSQDNRLMRFAFSFFPEGSNFDFEKKTITIPCTFLSQDPPEGVDLGLSAPIERSCEESYEISFVGDEAFTLDGIVVPLPEDSVYEKFVDPYEFEMTLDGPVDILDGSLLLSEGGKFEDYYQLILQRREQ